MRLVEGKESEPTIDRAQEIHLKYDRNRQQGKPRNRKSEALGDLEQAGADMVRVGEFTELWEPGSWSGTEN